VKYFIFNKDTCFRSTEMPLKTRLSSKFQTVLNWYTRVNNNLPVLLLLIQAHAFIISHLQQVSSLPIG